MNILTLSPEQKTKLLELCKEFFSKEWSKDCICLLEQKLISPHNVSTTKVKISTIFVCFLAIEFDPIFENKKNSRYIHWYQLCLTELSKNIYKKLEDKISNDYENFWNFQEQLIYCNHPVDYLYQFWQENK